MIFAVGLSVIRTSIDEMIVARREKAILVFLLCCNKVRRSDPLTACCKVPFRSSPIAFKSSSFLSVHTARV